MRTLLLAAFVHLSACSNGLSEAELVGVYTASYRGDTATLSLNADHSYTHIIQLKHGHKLEGEGKWKVSQIASDLKKTVVELSSFRAIPSFDEAQKEGWATEVDWTWLGRIQLCFDSDVGYCYAKQASS